MLSGFHTIAQDLRRSITEGDLGPNEQLPAIGDLARNYGTTAVTVRRALRALEEEGLVRVAHGVGTFVADWSGQFDQLHIPSFSAEMAASALASSTEVWGKETGMAAPAAAAALQCDNWVAMLARLRRVEGVPIVFQCSYIAPEHEDLVREYTPQRSLYSLLYQRTGRVPVSAAEEMRVIALPPHAAAALEAPVGSPAWFSTRTTSDAGGAPLLYDEAYFAGDRIRLRIDRRGAQSLLHYSIRPAPQTNSHKTLASGVPLREDP
jgi:GntR family transcriptional regulator